MHQFQVWAPKVSSCVVRVNGRAHAMSSVGNGWWSVAVNDATHGADYAFELDGAPELYPDPRSLWQPYGVHGASQVLDHSLFPWSDHGWSPLPLSDAVIYELHVGTFTSEGTFDAIIAKLPYLVELGITHVELMPVNSFTGRWGWGYDGVEIFAPQELYGGPHGLKRLVDACHRSGLAVLLDVVYNHFGPVGNYTGKFAPYVTENHHTPWGGAMNLEEAESFEVRRFFCENALMWMRDYHFDGLRLDAIHALVDRSAKHFLEQLSEETAALSKELGRPLVLIAESDLNDPRIVTPRRFESEEQAEALGGFGMDAQWSDDFHHALFAYLTGERQSYYRDFGSLQQLAKALQSAYVFDGDYSQYRQREHGRPIGKLSAHRFLGYIQNHDQVGNRATGDRLESIVGMRKAMQAAAMVLMSPFVPMLFQGDEFAASSPFLYFADHDDPEMARAVTEGRKREHASDGSWDTVPDPESIDSFEKSKLPWAELSADQHQAMLDWYRQLIHLRKLHEDLRNGDLSTVGVRFDEEQKWLILERGSLHVAFNFSSSPIHLPIERASAILLSSDADAGLDGDVLVLPADSIAVISQSR